MRLTWHIVLKDLTRMRLPMAFWAALFLAEFAVGVRFLNAGAMSLAAYLQLQILDGILFGLRVVIGYLMIAALMFDDPLVGSTAFWPTRPISGPRLLVAKLLGCLLVFGLLPVLVTLPWWLYCGYGIRQVWEASVDSFWSQATPLAVGFLIGALTGSVARFLVWTLVAIAAAGIAFAEIVKPASTHLFVHGTDITVDSPGVARARFMTLCVIAVAGWAVVVLHQFLTRRLVRSLVLLAVAAGLLGAEATWWPLAFRDRSLDMAARAAGAALDGRVTIQPSRDASLHIEQDPGIESGTVIFGNITVDGSPPELLMSCDRMEFTWLWPDGGLARAQGILLGRPLPSLRQWQSAMPHKESSAQSLEQGALRQQKPKNGSPGPYQDFMKENPSNRVWDYYVELPRPEALRMLTDPPSCTDYIDFRLLDASGMPVTSGTPAVTTASPLASVVSVYPVSDYVGDYFASDYIPGTFEAQIATGRPDSNGNNVFTITSGSFSYNVAFQIDTSGATVCPFASTAATTGTNSRRPVSKVAGKKLAAAKASVKKPVRIDVQ